MVVLLTGCATTDGERLVQTSSASFEAEAQALMDQPYIDPLTNYLIEHQGDSARAEILQQIKQERDLRCQEVARQYSDESATEAMLERYNLGYGYSCPEQVAVFDSRVSQQQANQQSIPEPAVPSTPKPTPKPIPKPTQKPTPEQISDQALSDCYLLSSIRNYSAARNACRDPANLGDQRSQVTMARISHLFEDYKDAAKWARMAAPESDEASFLLGKMYAAGQGVGQNMDQAVYWFNEAAKLGNKDAQAALDQYR